MTLKELNEKLFSITDKYNSDKIFTDSLIDDIKALFSSVDEYRTDRAFRDELRKIFGGFDEEIVKKKNYSKDFAAKNLEVEDKSSIFYDKSVVFTGDLDGIKRDTAAEYVHSKGGAVKGSISSKTDIVVIGSIGPGPSKLQKIEELINEGINIRKISEDEFISISGLK